MVDGKKTQYVIDKKKSTLLSKFPSCITGILHHPHHFYFTFNFPDDTDTCIFWCLSWRWQESNKASIINCSWLPWCRVTFYPLLTSSLPPFLPSCCRRPNASPQSLPSRDSAEAPLQTMAPPGQQSRAQSCTRSVCLWGPLLVTESITTELWLREHSSQIYKFQPGLWHFKEMHLN